MDRFQAVIGLIVMLGVAAVIGFIATKNEGAAFLLTVFYLFLVAGFIEDLRKPKDKAISIEKKGE